MADNKPKGTEITSIRIMAINVSFKVGHNLAARSSVTGLFKLYDLPYIKINGSIISSGELHSSDVRCLTSGLDFC